MDKNIMKLAVFLTDNNPDAAIIVIDADYKIVYANKKTCKLENMTFEEMVGASFIDVFFNSCKYNKQGAYLSPLIEAIDTGIANPNVEFHPHGSRFFPNNHWYKGHILIMFDDSGKPKYAIASYHDIDYQKQLEERLGSINSQIIHSMVTALDARDNPTGRHSFHVAEIASAFAKYLKLSIDQEQQLYLIGLIHDIGKIGVPESILTKPGKLTFAEYETIKSHASIGADILRPIDVFHDMVDSVRHHHERYDGKGYPDGLAGEDIPFFSRIIALCDSFDAMTGKRGYRQSIDVSAALEETLANCGWQFDPKLAVPFVSFIKQDKGLTKEASYSFFG